MEVFGSLEQRVLWKTDEETMDDLPPNVRLSKWLPQQDILGLLPLVFMVVSIGDKLCHSFQCCDQSLEE